MADGDLLEGINWLLHESSFHELVDGSISGTGLPFGSTTPVYEFHFNSKSIIASWIEKSLK